jgi:hypothetical protein
MEKGEWKIVIEEGGEVLATEANYGEFCLVVHQFMSVYGHWYVSCEGLFSVVPLVAKDLPQAKIEAKTKLYTVLYKALCTIYPKKE